MGTVEGFDGREISKVLFTDPGPFRAADGQTYFGGLIGIYLKAADGRSDGPHVLVQVGAPISLDTPFQELERVVLERSLLLMKRFLGESIDSLHEKLVETSRQISEQAQKIASGVSVTVSSD